MDIDLSKDDIAMIVRLIMSRRSGIVDSKEQADKLLHFVDTLEYCADVGTTMHLNPI